MVCSVRYVLYTRAGRTYSTGENSRSAHFLDREAPPNDKLIGWTGTPHPFERCICTWTRAILASGHTGPWLRRLYLIGTRTNAVLAERIYALFAYTSAVTIVVLGGYVVSL